MPQWITPFITGLFGVLAGIMAQWWRSSRDELRILCDEFCKLIVDAAQRGAEYWATEGDVLMLEGRLRGTQRQIMGFNALLSEQLHDRACDDIDQALSLFFDALTGGEFSVPNRPANRDNARRCHESAADVIIAVRQGFFYSTRIREKLWRATVGRMWPQSTWRGTFAAKR